MKSSAKQIQSSVSPNLRVRLSPSLTLKAFLRGLRWSKVKNCYTTAIYIRTGGLIRFYLEIWSVLSQFKWPLLFLHHRGRGRGTRLSIRSQDPNNSSDTERGPCLFSFIARNSPDRRSVSWMLWRWFAVGWRGALTAPPLSETDQVIRSNQTITGFREKVLEKYL